jgi:transcriptional regulator with XRE-family HTH domain
MKPLTGKKLLSYRLHRGMTACELGEKLGIHQTTVNRLEQRTVLPMGLVITYACEALDLGYTAKHCTGNQLAIWRQERGLSQGGLADMLKMTRVAILKYEQLGKKRIRKGKMLSLSMAYMDEIIFKKE